MRSRLPRFTTFFLLFGLFPLFVANSSAHPVPRKNHDRVVTVRLAAEEVVVDYHLEIDEYTVVFQDLLALDDQLNLAGLKPKEIYDRYVKLLAPYLADNLDARLDGKPLTFSCVQKKQQVVDSLQCDFQFRATWKPEPGRRHTLTFLDGTYTFPDQGQVSVSLTNTPALVVHEKSEADEALKRLPYTQLKPGDEDRLRKASAVFELATAEPHARLKLGPQEIIPEPRAWSKEAAGPSLARPSLRAPPAETVALYKRASSPETEAEEAPATPRSSLVALLDSDQGFWFLMLLAAGFGAAHALTPGHGKTLVAAYLVGERGTVWHALLLGLVTTFTHTGIVLLIAALLPLLFPDAVPAHVQTVLGLGGGLLIAGMGVWLLLRRLSGGADHIHLGGHGHHHHHHHHGDHTHDEHGNVVPLPAATGPVRWWNLVVLGINGGIVPCWDAILMLGLAISAQRLSLGLPLLLAFSAGLAGVLIAVGIAVVTVKGLADSRFGESRLFRTLPIFSAVAVTALGLWLCYDSLHPEVTRAPAVSQAGR